MMIARSECCGTWQSCTVQVGSRSGRDCIVSCVNRCGALQRGDVSVSQLSRTAPIAVSCGEVSGWVEMELDCFWKYFRVAIGVRGPLARLDWCEGFRV